MSIFTIGIVEHDKELGAVCADFHEEEFVKFYPMDNSGLFRSSWEVFDESRKFCVLRFWLEKVLLTLAPT